MAGGGSSVELIEGALRKQLVRAACHDDTWKKLKETGTDVESDAVVWRWWNGKKRSKKVFWRKEGWLCRWWGGTCLAILMTLWRWELPCLAGISWWSCIDERIWIMEMFRATILQDAHGIGFMTVNICWWKSEEGVLRRGSGTGGQRQLNRNVACF